MQKQKNIQMPFSFVTEVLRLIWKLEENGLDHEAHILCKSLESQIKAKIDAMIRRDTFTRYKNASSSNEREGFRRQYLELAGIHKDWVSDLEINQ